MAINWKDVAKQIVGKGHEQDKFMSEVPDEMIDRIIRTSFCFGEDCKKIGRVVQIRREIGSFGSDSVCLRLPDGKLQPHENQSFYSLSEEDEELYKSFYNDDERSHHERFVTYYDEGEPNTVYGAIVKSPFRDTESTPMREIKQAISEKIADLQ